VVVLKRRKGSSPFERTILSFNDLGFQGGKVTPKVTPFSTMSGMFISVSEDVTYLFIISQVRSKHPTPEMDLIHDYDLL